MSKLRGSPIFTDVVFLMIKELVSLRKAEFDSTKLIVAMFDMGLYETILIRNSVMSSEARNKLRKLMES